MYDDDKVTWAINQGALIGMNTAIRHLDGRLVDKRKQAEQLLDLDPRTVNLAARSAVLGAGIRLTNEIHALLDARASLVNLRDAWEAEIV